MVLAALWIFIFIGHDYIVPNTKEPILIALSDPSVHGLVGLVLMLPFWLYGIIDNKIFGLAVSLSFLIDIDHAIAAGSFDVKEMLSLPSRPISHSLLFSILIGCIVAYGCTLYTKENSFAFLFYIFFISLFSHVFRDAVDTDMTSWAYPFRSISIPKFAFFSIFIIVNLLHLLYSIRQK